MSDTRTLITFGAASAVLALAACLSSSYDVNAADPTDAGGEGAAPSASDADLMATGAYAKVVLADSPLAYYRLTEENAGIVRDETSNHNDAFVALSDCGFRRPGPLVKESSTSIAFGGTGCEIAIPDTIGFPAHAPFTLEAWVLTETSARANAVFGESKQVVSGFAGFGVFYGTDQEPTSLVASRTVTGAIVAATAPLPQPLAFHHIVYTYDGVSIHLYQDGQAQGVQSDNRALDGNGADIFIGSIHGSAYFNGQIAEAAIYPSALAIDRVLAHYNAGVGK